MCFEWWQTKNHCSKDTHPIYKFDDVCRATIVKKDRNCWWINLLMSYLEAYTSSETTEEPNWKKYCQILFMFLHGEHSTSCTVLTFLSGKNGHNLIKAQLPVDPKNNKLFDSRSLVSNFETTSCLKCWTTRHMNCKCLKHLTQLVKWICFGSEWSLLYAECKE